MSNASESNPTRWQQWKARLRNQYRLVVMNNETFEEFGSYQLSLLNVYVFISALVFVGLILASLLIGFTPLKRMIPGYGKGDTYEEVVQMQRSLRDMQKELKARQTYIDQLRLMLTDSMITEQNVPQPDFSEQDTIPAPQATEAELALREEVNDAVANASAGAASRPVVLTDRPPLAEQLYFVPPVNGTISAGFMPEKKHFGVDILAPKNTPIKAILDGYVFISDWTLETGNTIGIRHSNDLISFYKHNSALLKNVGDFVSAGEAVAIIGNTGTLSSGPHLHFELWQQGQAVDPATFFEF